MVRRPIVWAYGPTAWPYGLQHGPTAYSMALWPTAWPYGLQHGPMANSMALWPYHMVYAPPVGHTGLYHGPMRPTSWPYAAHSIGRLRVCSDGLLVVPWGRRAGTGHCAGTAEPCA